jgi:hypothetical protein
MCAYNKNNKHYTSRGILSANNWYHLHSHLVAQPITPEWILGYEIRLL